MGDLKSPRHSESRPSIAGPARNVPAEQQNLSRSRRQNSSYQIKERGLAGAIRADNGLAVASHDLERDVMQGAQTAEALGQAPQLENGLNAMRRRLRDHA